MFSIRNSKADNSPLRDEATTGNHGLLQVMEHLAALERAVYDETERRMSSQEQIREQVDSKIRAAVERLADATETEMARMYRRLDSDVSNRLDGFSSGLVALSSALTKLNRQMELISVELRETRDRLIRIEKKGSSDILSVQSSSGISVAGASEMSKLHEIVQNDLKNGTRINELNDLVTRKVMSRIESIEEWLKTNLTPEVLRLKESIKAEQILREDHDREIMQIVGQYTDIMRRHFDSLTDSTERDSTQVVSRGDAKESGIGRMRLISHLIDN
ncbi:hypothetical protein C9890_0551 [Perkinsus sp. BL_2016]|nr:hypothetical protein C9890_0551 [Perkinsus sp. BL_2016]